MTVSSFASDSGCGSIPTQWVKCVSAKDCLMISDTCGWPKAAVNKEFAKNAQKVNSCLGATFSCPTWDEKRDGQWVPACVKENCVAVAASNSPAADCEKKGGHWEGGISGRGRLTGCNMPTKDAGKPCTKGEDCESVCSLDGKCYGWQMFKGCALFKGHAQSMCME